MAMEASHEKLSPFVFLQSEDDENMSVCSITNIDHSTNTVKTPDELRGKTICTSFYGWLVFSDEDQQQFSIMNPLSLDVINFPSLNFRPEQNVYHCLLTSPPDTEGSMLILFVNDNDIDPYLMFCKIGSEQWTRHLTKEVGCLINPAMFNGKLYTLTNTTARKLVEIDLSKPDFLGLNVFDPMYRIEGEARGLSHSHGIMLESCGELFLVFLGYVRSSNEVSAVEVFRFDFSNVEWNKVESFKNRAFFLGHDYAYSCLAVGSGIEGNHVYYTLWGHEFIYSFNMEDKTISMSNLMCHPFWVMADSRNAEENKDHSLSVTNREMISESRELMTRPIISKEDTEEGDFNNFHIDIIFEIGKHLILGDYMSFRFVNKKCWLACPPIKWTLITLERFNDYSDIPPWLVFWEKGEETCRCFDFLRGEWHFIYLPDNTSKDVTMCYSVSGWCVMLQGQDSISLWNPLTKKKILLPPDVAYNCKEVSGCTMSSTLDQIVLILHEHENGGCKIGYIYLEEGEWKFSPLFDFDIHVEMNNNLVNYNGHIYVMDTEGDLAILSLVQGPIGVNIQLLEKVTAPPCSSMIYQNFLMECDGKLLAIFVGFGGEWTRIFTLDLVENVWVEVENLENKTLYVSRFSSFWASPSNPAMGDRVYFPRYHVRNNNIVYYSLKSKQLHVHGTGEVLDNFGNTKMQLFSSWVEPKWS